MREIFAEIYKGPGNPEVPPLRALALYEEFMELTPAGPEGDRIIAGLADRLVEVDLLDRAAKLLEGQVRSEEHTSELQLLMRISYAVFCLKIKHNIPLVSQSTLLHPT